jgi:precorrin-8X/cobalt-precorrin-8 methylmutase
VLANPPTRAEAVELLASALAPGGRALLAIDASLGWPAGTADALGLAGTPGDGRTPRARLADHLARVVEDGPRNANNRFAVASAANAAVSDGPGPWWGCPVAAATPTLSPTAAPGFPHVTRTGARLREWRATEQALRDAGLRPSSTWQLYGAGSVGSQSLLAVPALHRLGRRGALSPRWHVWPFDTGFTPAPGAGPDDVVVAEAWPSMVPRHPLPGLVRDAAQVWALAEHLRTADERGTLADAFALPGLDAATAAGAIAEEGWILGVRP